MRFEVSVLMKVLPHRHHPLAELRNHPSVIHHKLGVTLGCSYIQQTKPKAASILTAVSSTPPASISKTQVAVHNSSIPTTSSPIGSTKVTVTIPEYGGPEKREAEAISTDKWPQPAEFRSSKISFNSEVFHSSQYPRALVQWIVEVQDAKSMDELITIKNWRPNSGLRES